MYDGLVLSSDPRFVPYGWFYKKRNWGIIESPVRIRIQMQYDEEIHVIVAAVHVFQIFDSSCSAWYRSVLLLSHYLIELCKWSWSKYLEIQDRFKSNIELVEHKARFPIMLSNIIISIVLNHICVEANENDLKMTLVAPTRRCFARVLYEMDTSCTSSYRIVHLFKWQVLGDEIFRGTLLLKFW